MFFMNSLFLLELKTFLPLPNPDSKSKAAILAFFNKAQFVVYEIHIYILYIKMEAAVYVRLFLYKYLYILKLFTCSFDVSV